MANPIQALEAEHVTGPPIHDLVLPSQQPGCSQGNCGYETSSSVSSTSIGAQHKRTLQRTCCGITYDQFVKAVKIKKKYVPSKLAYFFFYAARSVLATYFFIFLTTCGLDPEQAGLIQGIRMIVLISGGMFWGLLADRSKKELLIVTIELCSFTLLMFSKPWVAYWITSGETPEEHRLHVRTAVKEILLDSGNITKGWRDIMHNRTSQEISHMFGLHWSSTHYKTGSTPLLLSMLGIGIGSAFFGGGVQVLLDSRVMDFTKKTSKNKNTYGRQRLWGSVAYSITPVLTGVILESLPTNKISPYMPVFYIHLILMAVAVVSFMVLFHQKETPIQNDTEMSLRTEQPQKTDGTWRFLMKTVKNPHMVIFLFNALWIGIGNGLQWSFQFIYMEEINATKTTMGLCALTQCATEAFIFPIATKIVNKIGGNKAAITTGIFGYAGMFLIFFLIRQPLVMVISTTIIGVCYTLYYTASLDEIYKVSNHNCMATLYACYNGIVSGMGNALAGIIGGIIYKHYGGRCLFASSGIAFLLIGIMNIFYTIIYKRSPLTNPSTHQENYKQFLDIYLPTESSTIKSNSTINRGRSDEPIILPIDYDNQV